MVRGLNPNQSVLFTTTLPTGDDIWKGLALNFSGTSLYGTTTSGKVLCFSSSSGAVTWSTTVPNLAQIRSGACIGDPASAAPYVFVLGHPGSGSLGRVVALNQSSGAIAWSTPVDHTGVNGFVPLNAGVNLDASFATPVLTRNGQLIVCTTSKVYRLDPTSGAITGSYNTIGGAVEATPAVDRDGRVYVADYSGILTCLNPNLFPGNPEVWNRFCATPPFNPNFPNNTPSAEVRCSPVIDLDGNLYVLNFHSALHKFDSNGTELLPFKVTRGKNCTTPVIDRAGRLIYNSSNDMVADRLTDLTEIWFDSKSRVSAGGVGLACDGSLYFGTFNFNLPSEGTVIKYNSGTAMANTPWPSNGGGNRRTSNAGAIDFITDRWCVAETGGAPSTMASALDETSRAVGNVSPWPGVSFQGLMWNFPGASGNYTILPQASQLSGTPTAITSGGWAVGYIQSSSSTTPVVWGNLSGPAVSLTGLPAPSGMGSGFLAYATDVLPNGDILGYGSGGGSGLSRGIFWTRSGNTWSAVQLGDPTVNQSIAYALNQQRRTVGSLQLSAGASYQAFRTELNPTIIGSFNALGTLSGNTAHTSSTRDINSAGDCVGFSQIVNGETRGFLLTANQANLVTPGVTVIGTFGGNASEAYGLNNNLEIVGRARIASGSFRAFLRTPNGTLRDLNTLVGSSGWVLENASAINSGGVIAGNGTLSGSQRGYVLFPTP